MYNNHTFSIIKPDAVQTGKTGPILTMINEAGFQIVAMKMVKLSKVVAESFYEIHKGKSFFNDLIKFMISGPVVVIILKQENAVEMFRKLIGNTDPAKADEGTIRHEFGKNIQMNAVHGSDSDENAEREADFFFTKDEIFNIL